MLLWVTAISFAQAAAPLVLLIGTPGSGWAEQAEILRKERGMMVISADELIARNPQAFQKFRNPTLQGVDPHLDPALDSLMEDALRSADLSKGVVLAGYPAAKNQGDFLVSLRDKYHLPKALVIHLKMPDEIARKRLKQQKGADVEQLLKDYHRELDFAQQYFPQTDIRDVDATKARDVVAQEIASLVGH
jgi:adenylate kinase family enzyme